VPPADENFPKITNKGTSNSNFVRKKTKKSKDTKKQTTGPSDLAPPGKTQLELSQEGSAMSLAKNKCLQCNQRVHAKECGKLLGCGHYFHPKCIKKFYKKKVCKRCFNVFAISDLKVINRVVGEDGKKVYMSITGVDVLRNVLNLTE
jgi:hypothetical protein